MSRLCRRLARKRTRRVAVPPISELRREAKLLREAAPDNPRVRKLCDAFEEVANADGYTRVGGGEATKPRPLHPLWKREPPEIP